MVDQTNWPEGFPDMPYDGQQQASNPALQGDYGNLNAFPNAYPDPSMAFSNGMQYNFPQSMESKSRPDNLGSVDTEIFQMTDSCHRWALVCSLLVEDIRRCRT